VSENDDEKLGRDWTTIGLSTRDSEGQGLITCIETNVDDIEATRKRIYTSIDGIGIGNQILDGSIQIDTEIVTKASVERSSVSVPVTSGLRSSSRGVSICRGGNSQKISSSLLHDEEMILKRVCSMRE
jgi:hypothetical protein